MTTFDLFRWTGVTAAVLATLTACSSGKTDASPVATVTVTAQPSTSSSPSTAPVDSPSAEATTAAATPGASSGGGAVFDSAEDDDWPPISDKAPPVQGTVFQADPGHDFTKGISPSSDGIVRAELRTMHDENVVEYVPVKWVGGATGHYEGPPQGQVMAFAAPLAKNVTFLSAVGCDGQGQTIANQGLGSERCSRSRLISMADKGGLYALVTVKKGQIVKVVQIYTP